MDWKRQGWRKTGKRKSGWGNEYRTGVVFISDAKDRESLKLALTAFLISIPPLPV